MPIATRLLDREAEWHEANGAADVDDAADESAASTPLLPHLPLAVRAAARVSSAPSVSQGPAADTPSALSGCDGPHVAAWTGPRPMAELSSTELRCRIEALLRQDAARDAGELDLADAVCAARWRNWPRYQGSIDHFVLRDALHGLEIHTRDLNRLASYEFAVLLDPNLRRRPAAWPAGP